VPNATNRIRFQLEHDRRGVGRLHLVAATFILLFLFKKRRREARKERPPQKQKLLRPAGYSGLCRLDDVGEEFTSALAQALAAGVLFGITAAPLYPLLKAPHLADSLFHRRHYMKNQKVASHPKPRASSGHSFSLLRAEPIGEQRNRSRPDSCLCQAQVGVEM
jgi:hypothetical protein